MSSAFSNTKPSSWAQGSFVKAALSVPFDYCCTLALEITLGRHVMTHTLPLFPALCFAPAVPHLPPPTGFWIPNKHSTTPFSKGHQGPPNSPSRCQDAWPKVGYEMLLSLPPANCSVVQYRWWLGDQKQFQELFTSSTEGKVNYGGQGWQ